MIFAAMFLIALTVVAVAVVVVGKTEERDSRGMSQAWERAERHRRNQVTEDET